MLRLFKLLILLPVAGLLVLLGVANRQAVTLFLDPLNRLEGGVSITLPLFVLLFAVLALGVLIGSISSWFAQGKHRKAERLYRRERDALVKECATLKAQQPPASALAKM
jgi:hypothetical protein